MFAEASINIHQKWSFKLSNANQT